MRMEDMSGVTDSNGEVTFTYPAFAPLPHVSIMFIPPNPNTYCRVVSINPTSCTVKVEARVSITVLGFNLLSFAVTNVPGVTVRVRLS